MGAHRTFGAVLGARSNVVAAAAAACRCCGCNGAGSRRVRQAIGFGVWTG